MRRTLLLSAVVPFVSAFLGGALAFSLVVAPQATAQSSQPQEVRASAFTLVGPDGTVLARLAPGPGGGSRLSLGDAAGTGRPPASRRSTGWNSVRAGPSACWRRRAKPIGRPLALHQQPPGSNPRGLL